MICCGSFFSARIAKASGGGVSARLILLLMSLVDKAVERSNFGHGS